MIKSKYSVGELRHHGNSSEEQDSPEEHQRLRGIFNEIKQRTLNNTPISVREREFFCNSVYILNTDGLPEDYPVCNDWRFKWLYLRYWYDLDGTSDHHFVKELKKVQSSRSQIEIELAQLEAFAEEWNTIIQDTTISDESLKEAAKETREELKALKNEPIFNLNGYLIQNRMYDRWRLSILIRLKFAYLLTEEIFAQVDADEIIYSINGQELCFNKFASIHIINRHYARGQKVVNLNKAFHDEDIPPRKIIVLLSTFIGWIDSSGLYRNDNIKKIFFRYKKQNLALWSEVKHKQKKGVKGNIPYNRIQTFYPIELHEDIRDLETNYTLTKIKPEFSIYIKNS